VEENGRVRKAKLLSTYFEILVAVSHYDNVMSVCRRGGSLFKVCVVIHTNGLVLFPNP
jgi:hypothetical protein